jgi:hypothetical protein
MRVTGHLCRLHQQHREGCKALRETVPQAAAGTEQRNMPKASTRGEVLCRRPCGGERPGYHCGRTRAHGNFFVGFMQNYSPGSPGRSRTPGPGIPRQHSSHKIPHKKKRILKIPSLHPLQPPPPPPEEPPVEELPPEELPLDVSSPEVSPSHAPGAREPPPLTW